MIDDGRPLSNEDIKDIRDIRQRDEYFDTIIFLLEYLTNKASENLIPIEACLLTKIRQSNAFELFLLEHGLWLRSDWGILNSKKASKKKLQKIAGLFAHLSEKERPDLWYFLKSFQTVYRPSRRGQYGRCSPPDEIQLQEMVDLLQNEYGLTISTEDLNNKLHEIAELFRSYKIMNQNGQLPNTTSLDETDNHGRSLESRLLSDSIVEKVKEIKEVEEDDNHLQYVSGEDIEKCKKYLENCLPRILQQILDNLTPRTQNLKHKILPAFRLLLCDGCSQVDLEQQLQITQSQVSRRIQPLYIQFFREVYLTVEDSWIRNQLKKLEKILTREKLQNYDEVNLKLKQCFGQYIAPMLFSAEDVKIGNAKTRKKCNNTENTSIYKNMLCNYLSTNTGNIENSQKAG